MFYRCICPFLLLCMCVLVAGCSALFSEQEWSHNYALLDGTRANSPEVIDGNMETVGQAQVPKGIGAPEVVIALPTKKIIRKIVIHSDNIKKFNLYIDKGGSVLSNSDWQLITEVQSAKKGMITIPVLYSFPTDKIRLVVLKTTDDAALTRQQGASRLSSVRRSGST